MRLDSRTRSLRLLLGRWALALLTGGFLMTTNPTLGRGGEPLVPGTAFFDALYAARPALAAGATVALYDWLLGSWDAEVVDHLPDGAHRRQSAEIHFSRVLEGRAIQDVWIAPERPQRGGQVAEGNRYGTTIRVYDPALDAWRITWINPVTGAENRLVGRRSGAKIVQTGSTDDGRLLRWIFDEIRPDAFHWRGERSDDRGQTWRCDTEFFARRRGGASATAMPATRHFRWEWTDRIGLEALLLESRDGGVVADGNVVVVLESGPLRVRYRIVHDTVWRFREARLEVGSSAGSRELAIRRLPGGRWQVDGGERPDLEGCEDIDLMVSPYTNTPALASSPLGPGESRTLRVAWVRFPSLEVLAVEQEYTRIDPADDHARYRYRNLDSGFVGELTVDADDVVLEYGPWRRTVAAET